MAIKVRRGTNAQRLLVTLEEGEIAYTTDTKKFYIGDGTTIGGNEVGGSTTLASLSDVNITGLTVGQLLQYDGVEWVNWTPDFYTLPAGGTTSDYIDGTGAIQPFPTLAQADRLVTEVRNETGSTVTSGTVVYLNGASGNKPLIALAQANAEATSTGTYGVVRASINNNQNGYVVVIGTVSGIDTSAFTAGTILWLSPTTPGGFTTTKPSAPNHAVYVAIVTRSHATQGTIEVKIQNGYELQELHNVAITSPSDKQVLYYDNTASLWKNGNVPDLLYGQNISVGTIEGNSGVAQFKFNTGAGAATPTLAVGNTNTTGKFASLLAGTVGAEFNFDKSGWFAIVGDTKANYNSNNLGSGSETYYLSVFGSTGNVLIGGSNTDAGYKLDVIGSLRTNSTVNFTGLSSSTTSQVIYYNSSTGLLTYGAAPVSATPTLDAVTTAGNTTTNAITVNKLTITGNAEPYNLVIGTVSDPTNWNQFTSTEGTGEFGIWNDSFYFQPLSTLSNGIRLYTSAGVVALNVFQTSNIGVNTTTDAGYKLDVNGTVRATDTITSTASGFALTGGNGIRQGNIVFNSGGVTTTQGGSAGSITLSSANYNIGLNKYVTINGSLTVTTSLTASAALAQGVYFNNTLVAAANNDVLVGLDINPTFTNGAFTGVSNFALRVNGRVIFGSSTSGQPSCHYLEGVNTSPTLVVRGVTATNQADIQQWWYNNNKMGYMNASGDLYSVRFRATGGNIANPHFSFLADQSAGMYFSNGVGIAISGVEKLKVFSATGNVLIQNGGTYTDAGYLLDVNGSTRLNGALTLGMTPIAAASVVSTHKLQVTIAGTTYYLLASNV